MTFSKAYTQFQKGELSEEQFAQILNCTVFGLRVRMGKQGSKFKLTLKTLDELASGTTNTQAAAEKLNCSTRTINSMRENYGVARPVGEWKVRRIGAKIKWDVHKKFALDFIAGTIKLEDAAQAAGLCDRQVRRWVTQLLEKHTDHTWKSHSKLGITQQYHLAREIETKEDLDVQRKMLADAIARGDKTVHGEATDRVVYMRDSKRRKRGTS